MIKVIQVISQRKFKVGYIISNEIWQNSGDSPIRMKAAYNYDGHYIGDSKTAHFLCAKLGIKPELIDKNHIVCLIGYSEKKKKYYGWSHRAIVGFKIGNKIFEARYGNDHTPFTKHGSQKIYSLKDARLSAVNFANYIS